MRIGYVMATGRGAVDLLLADLASHLETTSMRLCGVVQTNTDRGDCTGCDMDVRVLPSGEVLRISQSLGPEARGCRLDPSALEAAVGLVESHLSSNTDLLIINKFGKHEASGRGLRNVIGQALAEDVAVLVGLNAANKDAFLEFAGKIAEELPPDPAKLLNWAQENVQA